jgi:hypothetical protein
MKVTPDVCRFAMLVILLGTVAPIGAQAQQFVCWPITRGDTASGLALRLTGTTGSLYTDSFQIRDPARGLFVPKSHYERISPRWQACVARGFLSHAALVRLADRPQPHMPAYDITLLWRVGAAVTLVLFGCAIAARYVPDRAIPPDMQRAGEQFVDAFARPLLDPASGAPPIRARLRFVRRAQHLEICIAPNAGRRYPNLLDHKRNVEYDVNRVAQLIGTDVVVVSDRLRAEGTWVVVPIRRADLKQAGAK